MALRIKILDICNDWLAKERMFNLIIRKKKIYFEKIDKKGWVESIFEDNL